jgi:glycosyltransferase involved in cell wall biosynthesis
MKIGHFFADEQLESRGIKFTKYSKKQGFEIKTYLRDKKDSYFSFCYKTIKKVFVDNLEIIHAHRISGFLPAIIIKILRPKIKIIYDKHDIHKLDFIFDRLMVFADYVIVCSKIHLDYIRQFKKKSIIIPNYSDFKRISNEKIKGIRDELGIKKEEVLVLFQGSIVPSYGLDLLIKVAGRLNKKLKIGIIGWIKDKKYWKKIKENLGERIKYFGSKEYEEMEKYVSSTDIGVVLFQKNKLTEFGNPAKLFEFIKCKIPVVVTDIKSVSKYVKKYKNGIIIKDEEELVNAINKMSNLKIRRKYSKNSPNLKWDDVFKDYLKIIKEIY